jgi:hypothetical protein
MKISVADLMTVQAYSLYRKEHRSRLIAHRRARTVALGPAMRLQFEDELTVRYQIQEVLRAENVVDTSEMRHEIERYAHLLPDRTQWKATLMIELPNAQQRARELPLLNEAAHHVYVETAGRPRVHASANEDQPDGHRTRPSAVHFLRFALPESFRAALLAGQGVALGCDHPAYAWRRKIAQPMLEQLRRDLSVFGRPRCVAADTLAA